MTSIQCFAIVRLFLKRNVWEFWKTEIRQTWNSGKVKFFDSSKLLNDKKLGLPSWESRDWNRWISVFSTDHELICDSYSALQSRSGNWKITKRRQASNLSNDLPCFRVSFRVSMLDEDWDHRFFENFEQFSILRSVSRLFFRKNANFFSKKRRLLHKPELFYAGH